MSEAGQRAGLLYAILKTYKLVFDFHFNVTLKSGTQSTMYCRRMIS